MLVSSSVYFERTRYACVKYKVAIHTTTTLTQLPAAIASGVIAAALGQLSGTSAEQRRVNDEFLK